MPILEPDEVYSAKIHYWNKVYRVALLLLAFLIFATVAFSAFKINQNTQQSRAILNNIISCNTKSCKANKARQQSLQDYFKCLSVLKFEVPAEQLTTKEGVIKALDSCAQK